MGELLVYHRVEHLTDFHDFFVITWMAYGPHIDLGSIYPPPTRMLARSWQMSWFKLGFPKNVSFVILVVTSDCIPILAFSLEEDPMFFSRSTKKPEKKSTGKTTPWKI